MRFGRIYFALIAVFFLSFKVYAQTPPTKGQLIWLKAGQGIGLDPKKNVYEWKDASGHNNNAVQNASNTRPAYITNRLNGYPVVRFDGMTNFLTCPGNFPTTNKGYTVFVVVQPHSIGNGLNTIYSGLGYHVLWLDYTNYPTIINSGESLQSYTPLNSWYSTIAEKADGTGGDKKAYLYQNGVIKVSGPDTVTNVDYAFGLSNYAGYASYGFSGDIAEVLVYSRGLDSLEMDSVNNYFNHKFNINLPPDSDISLQRFPRYLQMYQRDTQDSAVIPIDGVVKNTAYDTIELKLFKNGSLVNAFKKVLNFASNGQSAFSFRPMIHAELSEYSVEIHLINSSTDTIEAYQKDIAAGDFFAIAGQSNTQVGEPQSAAFSSEYCRSFGAANDYTNYYTGVDSFWGWSAGYVSSAAYHAGGWGFYLQQFMHDSLKIPSCIINGGVGGTTIEENQKDMGYPNNPYTIYGRMLTRMQQTGADTNAKAMFWYQGESNGLEEYYDSFAEMRNNWMHDYPNLQKIYVVQIHTGCYGGSHLQIREYMRDFIDSFDNVETMSVMGVPGHDGCHYTGNNGTYDARGYLHIAQDLWRLVARDFYHSKDTLNITAPDVWKVFYRNSSDTSIGLLFKDRNAGLNWTADTVVGISLFNIQRAFYLNDTGNLISDIFLSGDTLVITPKHAGRFTNLTYIPDHYYDSTYDYYEGPWLMNRRNLGAFSFYHVPIEQFAIPKVAFGCNHLCANDTTLFIDSSTIIAGSNVSWLWNFGDGDSSASRNPQHHFASPGTYTVKLTVVSDLSRISSISKQITIHGLPNAQFTWKVVNGSKIKFTPNDTSETTYNWSFGDGGYATGKIREYTYNAYGTYIVNLQVTNQYGCTSTSSDTVIIIPVISLDASFIYANTCLGDTTIFTNTSNVSNDSIVSYNWNFGDTTNSTLKNPTHIYKYTGTYAVKLKVTTSTGKIDSSVVKVTINSLPNAGFRYAQTIFASEEFLPIDTTLSSYLWDFGDATSSNETEPVHNYNSYGIKSVKLTVWSLGGCKSSSTDSVIIFESSGDVQIGYSSLCAADSVQFINSFYSYPPDNVLKSFWDFGDSTFSTLTSPWHIFKHIGVHKIYLKVWLGSGAVDSNFAIIQINPPFSGLFKWNILSGNEVHFVPQDISVGFNSYTYTWNFNAYNTLSTNDSFIDFTFPGPGSYPVSLLVSYAYSKCTATSIDTVVVSNTSISSNLPTGETVNVYPNPFNQSTDVYYDLNSPQTVSISVFDLTGREVVPAFAQIQNAGNHVYHFDTEANHIPFGVYVLKISIGGTVISRQLVRVGE